MIISNTTRSHFIKDTILLSCLAFLMTFVYFILHNAHDLLLKLNMEAKAISPLQSQLFFPKLAIFGLVITFYRFDRIKTFFYLACSIFFIFFAFMVLSNFVISDKGVSQFLITTNYLMSKMWPVVMSSLLFWVAANQKFTTKQASISYPIILIIGSLSLLIQIPMITSIGTDISILYAVLLLGILAIVVICSFLFNDTQPESESNNNHSISLQQKSTYIFLLALIFICGEVVLHQLDINFKLITKRVFPNFNSYADFMTIFSYVQGVFVLIVSFLTCWMVWAFGWRLSALITPVICFLLLGIYWHAEMNPMTYKWITDLSDGFPPDSAPLLIIGFILALFKGFSGVLFMTTKQMAFIPLPSSTKAKALAFITLILGGQTISSLFFTLSLTFFPASDIRWFAYPVVIAICIWIAAIFLLAKRYEALNSLKERVSKPELNSKI